MRYYKVLGDKGVPKMGNQRWSLPTWKGPESRGRWIPGAWMPHVDPILCHSGYHVCRRNDLVGFLDYGLHIYVAEVRGVVIAESDKVVASEARLVERLPWSECAARLFAVECAHDVIHLMKDERSIVALEVAYRYALGDASEDERAAAGAAAWAAARAAAGAAAWAAARAAAWAAAGAAARAATWAAARAAARAKQTDRLMFWLGEK